MLRILSKLVAVGVIAAIAGQPLAMCLTSGHSMTAAEHDCCMKMASMCDSPAMPSSHSCCKQAVSPQTVALSKTKADIAACVLVVAELAPALLPGLYSREAYLSDSPPGSPPLFSTVLRI